MEVLNTIMSREKVPFILVRCKICGKKFYKTQDYVYKRRQYYFCSYTCMRKYDKIKNDMRLYSTYHSMR